MDFQLSEQQRRMIGAVRDLSQSEFKTNAQRYMDGTFPWENMRKLAAPDACVIGDPVWTAPFSSMTRPLITV